MRELIGRSVRRAGRERKPREERRAELIDLDRSRSCSQSLSRDITAVTDATSDLTQDAIASIRAAAGGALPQHVHLLGVPLDTHIAEPGLSTGPYKADRGDGYLNEVDSADLPLNDLAPC